MNHTLFILTAVIFISLHATKAQQLEPVEAQGIFIDKKGTMRWKSNHQEALFFGVNYTTPFAHAYRAHKQLGVDHEEAIKQDVYHLARLGLNAFRVHVWDVEISDREGNLLDNEHLRLFDFLLAELKKRDIKALITPIAFWGNGYPEPDENLPGFAAYYGKATSTVNAAAIKAQQNYLRQFFTHINPFTGLTYQEDPNVIATEINNEPDHTGAEEQITDYINTLQKAIKKTGWKKPVFYNISQNPSKARAVAKSAVDGFSFQWYPVGLVAGHQLTGNFLPHVDRYTLPFDTIPQFLGKPIMVYEFDAADQVQPVLFPAMARSFRQAGFQWATQFAYDPLSIAYANTEYQTHYLNLVYTPAKAISLMIAGHVFRSLPRGGDYGLYPASNAFGGFRLDYREQLSEMNNDTIFYYTATTDTKPKNVISLKHLAGVGSSALVTYQGTGAYFIDRLQEGVWRLELFPDVVNLADPFSKPSLDKEVRRVVYNTQAFRLNLPDLGTDFQVKALNKGNDVELTAVENVVNLSAGTYLFTRKGLALETEVKKIGVLGLNEFVAPKPVFKDISILPSWENKYLDTEITVSTTGVLPTDSIFVDIVRLGDRQQTILMETSTNGVYVAPIPLEWQKPGIIRYRAWVKRDDRFWVFPGNHQQHPKRWDYHFDDWWEINLLHDRQSQLIYKAANRQQILSYPAYDKNISHDYRFDHRTGNLVYTTKLEKWNELEGFGFQVARERPMEQAKELVIRARSGTEGELKLRVGLIDDNGQCYDALVGLSTEWQMIRIPLNTLKPAKTLLLPRPYPGFLPLWFSMDNGQEINLRKVDKLQLFVAKENNDGSATAILEVESVWLE